VKRLLCTLFGHKYYFIKRYTPTTRKIGCERCGRHFGMNDDVRCVVPWDDELEEAMALIKKVSK
jgi:hypothetical protein